MSFIRNPILVKLLKGNWIDAFAFPMHLPDDIIMHQIKESPKMLYLVAMMDKKMKMVAIGGQKRLFIKLQ